MPAERRVIEVCADWDDQVVAAVRTWRTEAKRVKLSRTEQDRMAPAFRLAER